jgi:hypothetical protein
MYNKAITFIALILSVAFVRPIPAFCQKLQNDTLKNKDFYFNNIGFSICRQERSISTTCRNWADGFAISLVDSTNKAAHPKVSFSIIPQGDFDIPSENQNKYVVMSIGKYEYVIKLDKNNRMLYIDPYLSINGRYKLDGSSCTFDSKGSNKFESTQYYRKGVLVNSSHKASKTLTRKARLSKKEALRK